MRSNPSFLQKMEDLILQGLFTGVTCMWTSSCLQLHRITHMSWSLSVVLWNFSKLHVRFCLAKGKEGKVNYRASLLTPLAKKLPQLSFQHG